MAGIPSVNTSTWRLQKKAHAVPEASYTDDMYRAKGLPTAPSAPTTGGSGLPVVDTTEWRIPPRGELLTEAAELEEPREEPAGLPYSEEDVVEYLRSRQSKGRVTVSELAQAFGGNPQAHTKFLQRLSEQGKLSYHRHKAGGFYTLAMELAEPRTEGCKKSHLKKRRPKVEALKKCKKKGKPQMEAQLKSGISVEVVNQHPGDFQGYGGQSRKVEVYVTGDTYGIKDDLKKLGLRWNKDRKAWGLWGGYSMASGKQWGTPIEKVKKIIDKVKDFAVKHNESIQKANQQKFAQMGIKAEPVATPHTDVKQWYKNVMGSDKAVDSLTKKYGMSFVPEFKPYGTSVGTTKIWVVGRTYDVRDVLKKFGFKFAKKVPIAVVDDARKLGVHKVSAGWVMDYNTFKVMKKQVFQALFKRMTKGESVEYRQEQRQLAGLELSEHLTFATGTPYRQLPDEVEGLLEAAELLSEATYYRQRFSNGDEIYFLQTGTLKNGNPKGFQVDFYGGRSKKAKKGRLLKMDVGRMWKSVPEKDVPKSVLKKFAAVEEGLEGVPGTAVPEDQKALAGMVESHSLPHCVTDGASRAAVRAHGILDDGQDGGDAFIDQVLSESRWFFRDFADLGLGVVRPFEETPGGRSGPWRGSDDEPAPTPIVRKGKVHGVVGKQKSPEEKGEVDVGKSEIDYDHDPDEPEEEPEKKSKKSFLKKKGKEAPPEEPEDDGAEDEEDDEAQTEGKLMKALARGLKGAGQRVSGSKHAQRARERLHARIQKFKTHHGIKDRD